MDAADARREFLEMVARPEERIDLAAAALLIAKEEYPQLDVESYRRLLDQLAGQARPRLAALTGNPFAVIDGLNTFLFTEQGFRGNEEEYFDPRNSFLNEVLDRRCGIPITLSVIYMEVAGRLGFPIQGVGFPGHFIVRHASGGRDILIDPFHGGRILMPEDCQRTLRAAYGEQVPLDPRFLQAVGKKQILTRMLINLKRIYLKSGDNARALGAIDRLIVLDASDPQQVRDRGLVHLGLGRLGSAAADLESYLRLSPSADDSSAVLAQIKSIRRLTALLN